MCVYDIMTHVAALLQAMCTFTRLSHLSLAHNSLKNVPDDFSNLKTLMEINFSNNNLKCLNENVFECNQLVTVKVCHSIYVHVTLLICCYMYVYMLYIIVIIIIMK